jgi:hypothetical protein
MIDAITRVMTPGQIAEAQKEAAKLWKEME